MLARSKMANLRCLRTQSLCLCGFSVIISWLSKHVSQLNFGGWLHGAAELHYPSSTLYRIGRGAALSFTAPGPVVLCLYVCLQRRVAEVSWTHFKLLHSPVSHCDLLGSHRRPLPSAWTKSNMPLFPLSSLLSVFLSLLYPHFTFTISTPL